MGSGEFGALINIGYSLLINIGYSLYQNCSTFWADLSESADQHSSPGIRDFFCRFLILQRCMPGRRKMNETSCLRSPAAISSESCKRSWIILFYQHAPAFQRLTSARTVPLSYWSLIRKLADFCASERVYVIYHRLMDYEFHQPF